MHLCIDGLSCWGWLLVSSQWVVTAAQVLAASDASAQHLAAPLDPSAAAQQPAPPVSTPPCTSRTTTDCPSSFRNPVSCSPTASHSRRGCGGGCMGRALLVDGCNLSTPQPGRHCKVLDVCNPFTPQPGQHSKARKGSGSA